MDYDVGTWMCSFCGENGSRERRLAGGLGAMICVPCVERFHALVAPPAAPPESSDPPWDAMSNAELLGQLPKIMRTSDQVDRVAAEWVSLIRDRGESWTAIGQALGVTRQAAWERFSKRISSNAAG